MDLFDEMLGKHRHSHRQRGHRAGRPHYFRHQGSHRSSRHDQDRNNDHLEWERDEFESNMMQRLLRQLMENKKAIGLLLLFGAVLLVLTVAVLIFLIPILLKMVGLAGEEGVEGAVELVKPVVETLKLGAANLRRHLPLPMFP